MTTRRDLIAGLTASVAGALVSEARAQSRSTSCVLTPQTGEGPFYFDPKLVRSDIREGQAGVPLALDIRVVTANDCMPIAKARVDVWHSDARGLYSGYSDQWGSGSSASLGCRKDFPSRYSVRRRSGARRLPHDLSKLVSRPHAAHSLQGHSRAARGRGEPDLFPRTKSATGSSLARMRTLSVAGAATLTTRTICS